MRTRIGLLLATAISSSAMAADLAVRAPAPVGPTYNWTGVYLGVNGGGMWGQQNPFNVFTDRFDSLSTSISGATAGGTLGAQVQMAHVVLGFEADLDWADVTGSATLTPTIFGIPIGSTFTANAKIDWTATARARVGYAQDNWLWYATGGVAILGNETNLTTVTGTACNSVGNIICSGTDKRIGAVVGGGLEYGFTPNWSAKLEYLYVAAASFEVAHVNEVRAGINYRFGGM
jgi:outer membrane immunogenic protein